MTSPDSKAVVNILEKIIRRNTAPVGVHRRTQTQHCAR
jgi:hypothetical protein